MLKKSLKSRLRYKGYRALPSREIAEIANNNKQQQQQQQTTTQFTQPTVDQFTCYKHYNAIDVGLIDRSAMGCIGFSL